MKDLNLIPKSYLLQQKEKKKKFYRTLTLATASLVLLAIFTIPIFTKMNLNREKDNLEKKITQQNQYYDLELELNALRDLYNTRNTQGNIMLTRGVDILMVLDKIERAQPEKLFITALIVNNINPEVIDIKLNGVANTEQDIATFVSQFRKDEDITRVHLGNVMMQGSGVQNSSYSFNLDITIKSRWWKNANYS